jgi:cytochrome P450
VLLLIATRPLLSARIAVHRDPRYFSPDPDAFWPERWLSGEGPKLAEARGTAFALNQGAYMPFNYGPLALSGLAGLR